MVRSLGHKLAMGSRQVLSKNGLGQELGIWKVIASFPLGLDPHPTNKQTMNGAAESLMMKKQPQTKANLNLV